MKKFLLAAIGACAAITVLGCLKGTDEECNELVAKISSMSNNAVEAEVIQDGGLNSDKGDNISVEFSDRSNVNLDSLEVGQRIKVKYNFVEKSDTPIYTANDVELIDSDRINNIKDKLGA